ncbi:dTDP-4-dehydrorhamnose reductase [Asaia lannensis]|uniref:dTDP-4-dehydrorhamnose reductase n=1 Tax=Asaia lannensis NBRC 102526 TaxID=1307926 RepID=A0ABT1CH92_9PROT|nr:dTDP-4-dehydrorhamnose reductase [Asaia lannensis]MCO6160225.1 dTDP-4-dehydrorhamnose reductase [Asaia lannensis NBRC 102526]GBQ94706.1 dTDP-4-dehydrorhamnose reductase [Asaia lannensis NBRC 102526]
MSKTSDKPILVTGGQGQLATSLRKLGGDRVVIVGRPEFDLAKPETIAATLDRVRPALVVNAAAWTAVDLAETEIEGATAANETGPAELARLCAAQDIPLIHVSTDYVYAGDKGAPYVETDPVTPQTVYGRTKAAGEQAVLKAQPRSIVLRTAWVYSGHCKNFVRTMVNAGAKNAHLKVVGDQYGCPTNADDLAKAILDIADRVEAGWQDRFAGIYHACGTGETSWHGLAVAALEEATRHGQAMPVEVAAIRTEDWPTPAKRPQDSRLDCSKLETVFGVRLPEWRDGVARAVDEHFATQTA